MQANAIVFQQPKALALSGLTLPEMGAGDLLVKVEYSGISTGTERLLWEGTMPAFPGMGYPLVPGYETVGRVVAAGDQATVAVGTRVYLPGSQCFTDARNLFGGSASRLMVPSGRAIGGHGAPRPQRTRYPATGFDRRPRRAGPHDCAPGRTSRS